MLDTFADVVNVVTILHHMYKSVRGGYRIVIVHLTIAEGSDNGLAVFYNVFGFLDII